jgi:hypothetical protein
MRPLSSGFGFHFFRQSFDGYDLYGFSFFTNVSLVALQYSPSTKTFPPLASIGRSAFIVFPHRRFFADLNRRTLRTESFAYNKREERLNLVGRPPD